MPIKCLSNLLGIYSFVHRFFFFDTLWSCSDIDDCFFFCLGFAYYMYYFLLLYVYIFHCLYAADIKFCYISFKL